MPLFRTHLIERTALAITILFSMSAAMASTVPCSSTIPMWCLDWDPHYQVWDPDGNKDYQNLPAGLLTATLIDRNSNQLLVGPVQIGGADKPGVLTMILDNRIESHEWTDGVHLHSSSKDDFDLRLILHTAPQYIDPQLARPNQEPLPLDADLHIGGVLKLGDEEHVWLFPTYGEEPITFDRLRAAGADTAMGFGAYVDFRVSDLRIEPETLTLYIDADADGEPERTIDASPLSAEEHQKLIVVAQAKAKERAEQREYTPVAPVDGWNWEWLKPHPTGNTLNDICLGPDGDLLAVDAVGFVLRRRDGKWTVDGDQLDEGLYHIVTAPDGQIYVASTSRIWRKDGGRWVNMEAPEARHIEGLVAWEGQRVVAVAAGGEVLQHGPGGWRQSRPGGEVSWSAVWGSAPDDVWITGSHENVFHFDGQTWAPVPHELPTQIRGVWGFGPRDVYFMTSAAGGGKVWRWSGEGRWRQLQIPNIPWAAVHSFRGTGRQIELSTGNHYFTIGRSGWEKLVGWPDYALGAYCRDGDGKLVGVGESGRTWEYGSEGWTEVDPRPLPLIRRVWGLEGDDLYATGNDGKVWRWDGMRLAEMDSLTGTNLQGIWGSSSSDIHVASVRGIWHWDGQNWKQTWEPWQGGIGFGLELWGSGPDDIWAVGSDGAMVHFDGRSWERVEGVTGRNLRAIWGGGPDDVYVGGDETLLRYDGEQWSTVPGFKRLNVSHLWGSDSSNVWAATDQGLYRYDGETWERTKLREWTTGVWGTSATDVLTLTQDQVLQFDGSEWRSARRIDSQVISELWGLPGEDLLAFGRDGSVLVLRR
ncbi:MAG: hypothetical protein GY838_18760 [bacterium]|nr:hypothetical protein [bacterium]